MSTFRTFWHPLEKDPVLRSFTTEVEHQPSFSAAGGEEQRLQQQPPRTPRGSFSILRPDVIPIILSFLDVPQSLGRCCVVGKSSLLTQVAKVHENWRWNVLQQYGVYYDDYMQSIDVKSSDKWRMLHSYVQQVHSNVDGTKAERRVFTRVLQPTVRLGSRHYRGSLELADNCKFFFWETGRCIQIVDVQTGETLRTLDTQQTFCRYFHRVAHVNEKLFVCLNDRIVCYNLDMKNGADPNDTMVTLPMGGIPKCHATELLVHRTRLVLLQATQCTMWDVDTHEFVCNIRHPHQSGSGFEVEWMGSLIVTWVRGSVAPLRIWSIEDGSLVKELDNVDSKSKNGFDESGDEWVQVDAARVTWGSIYMLDHFLLAALDRKSIITLWDSSEDFKPIFRFNCGCLEPFDLVLTQDFLAVINDDLSSNKLNVDFWKLWLHPGFDKALETSKRPPSTAGANDRNYNNINNNIAHRMDLYGLGDAIGVINDRSAPSDPELARKLRRSTVDEKPCEYNIKKLLPVAKKIKEMGLHEVDSYFASYRNFLNIGSFHKNGLESLVVFKSKGLKKKLFFPAAKVTKFEEWLAIQVSLDGTVTLYDFRPNATAFDDLMGNGLRTKRIKEVCGTEVPWPIKKRQQKKKKIPPAPRPPRQQPQQQQQQQKLPVFGQFHHNFVEGFPFPPLTVSPTTMNNNVAASGSMSTTTNIAPPLGGPPTNDNIPPQLMQGPHHTKNDISISGMFNSLDRLLQDQYEGYKPRPASYGGRPYHRDALAMPPFLPFPLPATQGKNPALPTPSLPSCMVQDPTIHGGGGEPPYPTYFEAERVTHTRAIGDDDDDDDEVATHTSSLYLCSDDSSFGLGSTSSTPTTSPTNTTTHTRTQNTAAAAAAAHIEGGVRRSCCAHCCQDTEEDTKSSASSTESVLWKPKRNKYMLINRKASSLAPKSAAPAAPSPPPLDNARKHPPKSAAPSPPPLNNDREHDVHEEEETESVLWKPTPCTCCPKKPRSPHTNCYQGTTAEKRPVIDVRKMMMPGMEPSDDDNDDDGGCVVTGHDDRAAWTSPRRREGLGGSASTERRTTRNLRDDDEETTTTPPHIMTGAESASSRVGTITPSYVSFMDAVEAMEPAFLRPPAGMDATMRDVGTLHVCGTQKGAPASSCCRLRHLPPPASINIGDIRDIVGESSDGLRTMTTTTQEEAMTTKTSRSTQSTADTESHSHSPHQQQQHDHR